MTCSQMVPYRLFLPPSIAEMSHWLRGLAAQQLVRAEEPRELVVERAHDVRDEADLRFTEDTVAFYWNSIKYWCFLLEFHKILVHS